MRLSVNSRRSSQTFGVESCLSEGFMVIDNYL